jgi:hypothetical protein
LGDDLTIPNRERVSLDDIYEDFVVEKWDTTCPARRFIFTQRVFVFLQVASGSFPEDTHEQLDVHVGRGGNLWVITHGGNRSVHGQYPSL